MKGIRSARFCLALILATTGSVALPPTIGIASAAGVFLVNSNQVDGNANLFDGSRVRTGKASSQVFLQTGAALTLGIDSAATIYRDRLVLEQGATKVDNLTGYSVRADNYRIEQAQPASEAVVRLDGNMLEVAALAGALNVFDAKGALLTHIGANTASAFQTGASKGGTGSPTPNNNNPLKQHVAAILLTAAYLAGLGLAVATIVEPPSTSR